MTTPEPRPTGTRPGTETTGTIVTPGMRHLGSHPPNAVTQDTRRKDNIPWNHH